MRRIAAILASVTMLAGPARAGSSGAEALAALDQFMIVRAVAARCSHGTPAAVEAFQHKYDLVVAHAAAALKLLASDLAQPHIEKLIGNHYDEIDRRVSVVVAQESCDGPHAQQALQKYDNAANTPNIELLADNGN